MKIGIWFYGFGTIFTGMLNIAWGAFDASHQPVQSLGKSIGSQPLLAYVVGVALIAAGIAILWKRSERIGAAASAIAYLIFAGLWLFRYSAAFQAFGLRIDVLFGVTFGLAQQIMLMAPAVIVYASTTASNTQFPKRAVVSARWMLGVPPVIFGIFHLIAIRVFAGIVPGWIPFGTFWAVLTGIAFVLAGCAICSGIKDVLAARLLAWMLLLFEGLVEVPPIFSRLHNEATWGAAVYNVTAIGACLIFAEYFAHRMQERRLGLEEDATLSRPDTVVA